MTRVNAPSARLREERFFLKAGQWSQQRSQSSVARMAADVCGQGRAASAGGASPEHPHLSRGALNSQDWLETVVLVFEGGEGVVIHAMTAPYCARAQRLLEWHIDTNRAV